MGLIQRFLLGNRVDDDLQVGLFLKNDGTVWLRNPDASETQVDGGGGGGFPPSGWTVDADGAFTLSPDNSEEDLVAFRIKRFMADAGDFVELVITDEVDVDWLTIYNHTGWSNDREGAGVFAFGNPQGSGQISNWFGVTNGSFGVAAPGTTPPGDQSVSEADMAWGVQVGGPEFLMVVPEPDDDTVTTSQLVQWFDDTAGAPEHRFKARDANDDLVAGKVASLAADGSAFLNVALPLLAATPTVAQISTVLAGLGLTRQT